MNGSSQPCVAKTGHVVLPHTSGNPDRRDYTMESVHVSNSNTLHNNEYNNDLTINCVINYTNNINFYYPLTDGYLPFYGLIIPTSDFQP